ncbi:hypothetical protein [Sulfurimonas microaerophilic]|uniref:hypothetical protein n=1 Tax=Sulfurimonas microaerophilic TaxID=3058392 RepID=UPI0027152F1F|nr:hypothetical protein [Sulfurimonas sp. hsl 1-7]
MDTHILDSVLDIEDENLSEHTNALKEVEYLNSIPNLIASIREVMELDDSDFSEEIEW